MLVIPLKITDQTDIATPLLSWLLHQENQNQSRLPPQLSSSNADHLDLLSDANQNHPTEKSNAINGKNMSDGLNGSAANVLARGDGINGTRLNNGQLCLPSSQEAEEGLHHLSSMRRSIAATIDSRDLRADTELTEKILNTAMEYHASLLECEHRGFPTKDEEFVDLQLTWQCAFEENREPLILSNLFLDQAAILFNIGALESHMASKEDMSTKRGLTSAVNRYNMAASIFAHIRTEVLPRLPYAFDPSSKSGLTLDLTPSCLKMCENMLLAQGQACMYEMARFRPMHNVLAKISMGAAEIYSEALFSSQDRIMRAKMSDVEKWGAHFKAMSLVFRARAEYHESICARETANKQGKPGHGLEIARLSNAESLCEQAIVFGNKRYVDLKIIADLKLAVLERKGQAEEENEKIHKEKVPSPREVEPTRGQRMSKIVALRKSLLVLPNPLFRKGLNSQAKFSVDRYHAESNEILNRCTNLVNRETDSVRNTLAKVNLPQSLTTYTSSLQGIPHQIWQKVEASQNAGEIERLKTSLWELKELSSSVHKTANDINEQLEEDVKLDSDFRKKYPAFAGHDVGEVQQSTRRNMEECGKLLADAKSGDTVLLQYLQKFETDSKYKLLQCSRQHLDNLANSASKGSEVETETLSRYLVDLSTLIHEREHLLKYLKQEYESFDIKSHTKSLHDNESLETSKAFEKLIDEKLISLKQIQLEIKANIEKQASFLHAVLNENDKFVQSQAAANASSSGQNYATMLEEGLNTIKIVKKWLDDGRVFYNMIVPRLKQLQQYVSFMSVRLAVQRFDHEDNVRAKDERLRQEIEDEKVAKKLSQRNVTDTSPDSSYVSRPNSQRYENDDREIQGNSQSTAAVASPAFPLSPPPQPPGRRNSESATPRVPHQTGSDSLRSYLLESSKNRTNSSSEPMIRNPPAPSPSLPPTNRSSSMSNFGRASSRNGESSYQPPSYASQPTSAGQPGVYFQSNFKPPPVRVDDEKVARLVAMDFDPEKVVISLQKYDNNFDQALNDLLSC